MKNTLSRRKALSAGLAFVSLTASSGCFSRKSPAWEVRINGPGSPRLAVSTQTAFIVSDEGTVYAIDQEGTIKWSSDYPNQGRVSPTNHKEGVIVPCTDGRLRRFKSDGVVKWSSSIQANSFMGFPPVGDNEILSFMHPRDVFRVHPRSGKILDHFQLSTKPVFTTESTESYIIGTDEGSLLTYSSANNSLQEIRRFSEAVYPEAKDGILIITSGHSVQRQTLSGEVIWNLQLDPMFYQPPSLGDRTAFVVSGGGLGTNSRLYSVELKTGSVRWMEELEGRAVSSPTVVEDTVIIATDEGKIASYENLSGDMRWGCKLDHTLMSKPAILGPYVITTDENGTVLAFNSNN